MAQAQATDEPRFGAELVLIRHGPVAWSDRLCGRTDTPARLAEAPIAATRKLLPAAAPLISSPARRCIETAAALYPGQDPEQDAHLWEQDFGAHDGLPYADLPDIGVLSSEALAAYAPPQGESFADVAHRIDGPLRAQAKQAHADGRPRVLVVHAGVIRAALGLVMGHVPAGLAFEIAHLSVTRLRAGAAGPISIIEAGKTAP